jgi:phage terminase large subunit-like protein
MSEEFLDPEEYEKLPPAEKKQVDEMFEQYARSVEQNPLLAFHPHAKQHEFLLSDKRYKGFFGGNRSGKTEGSVVNDLIQCCPDETVPDHLKQYKKWHKPINCRIVAPKFNENHEQVIFPKIRELVPKMALKGGTWERAFSKQRRLLTFANGSTIQFLTFEQDVDAHAGAALHLAHFDEEPPGQHGWQIYRETQARLIDYAGDFVLSMTPLLGMSWAYDEFWEKRGKESKPGTWESDKLLIVQVDMDDNPHLSQEAKEEYLAGLTQEERVARKEGKFVHFGGLVYADFNTDRHLIPDPTLEHVAQLDHVIGIDPGINTTAVVFCGFDKDNSLFVLDELYLHNENAIPEAAARLIRAKQAEWGMKDPVFVIDPSARNRASVNADNIEAAYQRAGITTIWGQNEVEAGVFEMKRRLQASPPRLYVNSRCESWRYEQTRYRVDTKKEGYKVVKEDDHLMDATRYVAMYRPMAPPREAPDKVFRSTYIPDYEPPLKEQQFIDVGSEPMGSFS